MCIFLNWFIIKITLNIIKYFFCGLSKLWKIRQSALGLNRGLS